MEILRILTLVYAAVLVLALAASLTAILIFLRKIASALSDTHEALARVEERTRPLEELMQPLNPVLQGSVGDLKETAARLQHADAGLDRLAERLGLGALTDSATAEE
jgi:hypothetical protein